MRSTPAALLYVETIANPQIDVADLPALGRIAAGRRARLLVDNTVATPLGCRPLEHGATLVAHSATKYLNGHSDALAGVARRRLPSGCARSPPPPSTGRDARPRHGLPGAARVRTLDLRLERAAPTPLAIARMLERHPRVAKVRYPGLESDRSFAVAQRVLSRLGGLLSFDVEGGADAAAATMDACRLCLRATSLGGVETTVSHPASTSHRQLSEAELRRRRPDPGDAAALGRDRGRSRPVGRSGRGAAGVIAAAPLTRLGVVAARPGASCLGTNFLAALITSPIARQEPRLQLSAIVRDRGASTCS